ncbi:YjiH family protein [Kytococcus sedentarius]|uniref:YjiH family protein n=1 Tax=Kytococcus sedentarius TaxID=1276 RepID=UPI00385085C9
MSTPPAPQADHATSHRDAALGPTTAQLARSVILSLIGIVAFFVPVSVAGTRSIPLDHIVTWIRETIPSVVPWIVLVLVIGGAIVPFVTGQWRRSTTDVVFSIAKVIGAVVGCLIVFEAMPGWLAAPGMGPFLWEKLVIPVGLLVPVGAIFLALLVGYGLLEFVGVLMQPVMRPLFRTPGRSAIDAVASFVGSYSLGLLITNRVYKEGRYSVQEAAIIATGFSTVSATFMIVVAKTLGLMGHWNTYFWVTLAITFAVTAVTVRLWPLNRISTAGYQGREVDAEERPTGSRLAAAWRAAKEQSAKAPPLARNIAENLRDGVLMAMAILPSILSVGLLGLVLAEYTPVFDWLGYVFYPITALLGVPEAMLAAKASALGIAEMFLPALLVAEASMVTKFVIAVVCVSQIIFFSALVPCVVATEIPLRMRDLVVVWFERVVLTLVIAIPVAHVLF